MALDRYVCGRWTGLRRSNSGKHYLSTGRSFKLGSAAIESLNELFRGSRRNFERSPGRIGQIYREFHVLEDVHLFTEAVLSVKPGPVVVELGAWGGNYLPYLAEHLRTLAESTNTTFVGVDGGEFMDRPFGPGYTLSTDPVAILAAREDVLFLLTEPMQDLYRDSLLAVFEHDDRRVIAVFGKKGSLTPVWIGHSESIFRTTRMIDLVLIWRMFGYVRWQQVIDSVMEQTSAFMIVEYASRRGFRLNLPSRDEVEGYLTDHGMTISSRSTDEATTFWYILARR